ncbi:MAG: SDR family NAD(P)-dependent oxidoreductase [Phaeodactylibacter xiamenensis]|uniref:SDR family NAD(P)-dependent oxidoreductase n=1 Tax=Phaeodactylibacter xiamenensis TaxID=1524460 RepID=UPI0009DFD429|nr:SDR family NAD(P)-dependent oxidoreductase [Phaeodactylibacter xiamenensis]
MSTNSIALAYCADNESTVAEVQEHLSASAYTFHHYSCNRSTDNNFLTDQLLGQSDPILLFISDNYLKSAQCMSRGLKLLQEKRHDILPIIIDGITEDPATGQKKAVHTDFERVSDIIQYINYWQDQYLDLRRQKRQMNELDEDHFNTHLKVMREVSSEVGEFLRLLRSMNYLILPQFKANAYQQFFIFTEDEASWTSFKTGFNPPVPQPEPTAPEPEALEVETEAEPDPDPEIIANIPGIDKLYPEQSESNVSPEMDEPVEDVPAEAPESNEQEDEDIVADTPTPEPETGFSPEDEETETQSKAADMEDGSEYWQQSGEQDHEEIFEPVAEETSPEEEVSTEIQDQDRIERALSLLNNGQVEDGLQTMADAIEAQPDNATLRYHYALMLARSRKDYHSAREELLPVIELDPENTDALFLLGELEELEGDFESARSHYLMLLDVDEDYPNVYYRLGMITAAHFEEERAEAAKYFRKAAKQDRSNYDALYQYALLLNEALGKPEKAVKYFKKTLKVNAFHPFAYYDMALVYHQLGEYRKAADAYQKAIQINPELKTAENDEAFAIAAAQAEGNTHEKQTSTSASGTVNMSAIEALKDSIVQLEQLLREKEETVNDLEGQLAARPATPPPPPRPKVDQTVLITGATSGIGKATASLFAEKGYRVIITGRRRERLDLFRSQLTEQFEAEVMPLTFDVRSEQECEAALHQLSGQWAEIDILINNAGKAKGLAPVHEGELRHWEEMIDTNLKGLLYMTRLVAPGMVARGTGHIINVCSTAGKEAYPNGNVYNATKFGVDGLTKAMRMDLHKHGVRVGMVSPAHVEETEFALVRFDGDESRARIYEDFKPLASHDVAESIYFIVNQPAHVNILDVVLQGTQQASSTIIDRSGRDRYEEEE